MTFSKVCNKLSSVSWAVIYGIIIVWVKSERVFSNTRPLVREILIQFNFTSSCLWYYYCVTKVRKRSFSTFSKGSTNLNLIWRAAVYGIIIVWLKSGKGRFRTLTIFSMLGEQKKKKSAHVEVKTWRCTCECQYGEGKYPMVTRQAECLWENIKTFFMCQSMEGRIFAHV